MAAILKKFLLICFVLLAVLYAAAAAMLAADSQSVSEFEGERAGYQTITIFGASGTAGDGLLKAALADPDIKKIQVITRRSTPRIDQGVASGKVEVTLHMDYNDYSAVRAQISHSNAVYWAIGTSSLGVDEETYAEIHVDFPMRMVEEWVSVGGPPNASFHYISSSDISEASTSMWAQQKFRAEQLLFALAEGEDLKVIAYRPDYIGPTREEAHLGQDLLFWFFRPLGAAVRAKQIGQAMIEVSARASEFANGDTLSTRDIIAYSDSYERAHQ